MKSFLYVLGGAATVRCVSALSVFPPKIQHHPSHDQSAPAPLSLEMSSTTKSTRRHVLSMIQTSALVGFPMLVSAEEDLTSQLYNEDGSLRDANTVMEAKSRPIAFQLAGNEAMAVDGLLVTDTKNSKEDDAVTIRYELPEKWRETPQYQDGNTGFTACRRISVYRFPITKANQLKKAVQNGVIEQLRTQRVGLGTADLIGGRTSNDYYEFDLASAPSTCNEKDAENLGLGFCPYQDIFLLAATVADEQLYVFCIEADKDQWKKSNAELRRVRSTFRVEQA